MIEGPGHRTRPGPRRHSVRPVVGGALRRRVSETLPDKRAHEPACVPPPAVGVRETEEVDECQHSGDTAEHRVLHGRQGRDGKDESSDVRAVGGQFS